MKRLPKWCDPYGGNYYYVFADHDDYGTVVIDGPFGKPPPEGSKILNSKHYLRFWKNIQTGMACEFPDSRCYEPEMPDIWRYMEDGRTWTSWAIRPWSIKEAFKP